MLARLLAPRPLSRHPVDVGQRTEAVVLAELVRRGHDVLVPFGTNHRYDLVVDLGDRFLRVQCKTGRLRRGCVVFNARSTRTNTVSCHSRDYRGEVDAFAVHCPGTGGTYVVPIDDAMATDVALRVAPPENGQHKGIRWARDYELVEPYPRRAGAPE